jgi:hypothetical protein
LSSADVHKLDRVSLSIHFSPRWGILKLGGQWFLHIIIIIIIIIGKDTTSFMHGIYTHIPETNHVLEK